MEEPSKEAEINWYEGDLRRNIKNNQKFIS